ncbi:Bacterial alpha-L-rhamnosidase [Posidoniimonas polymericola]|uniref:alpha-L-rhamnosidase n=1 Tax=Posidoniimonas polymericola TaxID=2528002 RepID=A0A5C5ZHJ3_9BACT|nr:family 78 glycoside hydrolase catalytic domain [Posidoniimonas polymericola]TWT86023.1 Bacterial alpha-L-rhamnosidase [Posidoniimonas polymericola]
MTALVATPLRAALLMTLGLVSLEAHADPLRVDRVTCEYAENPLGVDVPAPRLTWKLESDQRNQRQTAYEVLVASSRALLNQNQGDLWSSGKVASDETVLIPYDGEELESSQPVFWKVRVWNQADEPSEWSELAQWTMGVLDEDDWRGEWVVAPWESESVLLRKDFTVKPGLKRAVAHVCGLGHYELTLNGHKSGEALLAPGWTKYNRTCLYETHDITRMLQEGANAAGVALGDGMYHTERRNRFSKFQGTFGPKRLIGQIELWYEDGSHEVVATDASWRVSRGPTTYNDIYGGEDYDARLLEAGWDSPGFDAGHWDHAVLLVRPGGKLRGHTFSAPPLQAIESIEPVAVQTLSPTRDVIDLGQNTSYMPRIRVSGPAGSTVRLTHAEIVNDDGSINRGTCGGNRGPAYWQYTKATDQPEEWFPRFFYAGCRYLQLDKLPAEEGGKLPSLDKIEGVVVHSIAAPTGEFRCSSDLLNQVREVVRWAQRSNMVSVLTDCPHREKLGWLEQYHLNGPAIRYEFDVAPILIKGMRDMADSQTDDGLIPNIAPEYVKFPGTFRAAAEWGAALILVPWQHYQATGDSKPLADYYDVMQRYMQYLDSKADGYLLDEGLGDWYDLGPADRPGHAQLTPPQVTATAFYFLDAKRMAQIAELLGKQDDARRYQDLAAAIREAWLAEFRHEDGSYATDSQCSNAIALWMGLAREDERQAALAALIQDIRDRGDALTAGDVGWRYEIQSLADAGRNDVLYDLFTNPNKPGYAMLIGKGVTSLTEAWDANRHSSHNHFMLGHITEWFYKDLVGIGPDPTAPGYRNVLIKPQPVDQIDWAEGSYDSIRGPVRVRWEREGPRFLLEADLPPNTTATIHLPGGDLTEGVRPAAESEGVLSVEQRDGRNVVRVGSGSYAFVVE